MDEKLKRILCFLNIHKWKCYYKNTYWEINWPHRECIKCGEKNIYNHYCDRYLLEWPIPSEYING